MRIFKALMLSLCFLATMSGTGYAKSVFLRDGSELECEAFRRQGNLVVVKVNRDVVVEFASEEVDLDKTFRKVAITKKHKPARHKAAVKAAPRKSAKTAPAAAAAPPAAPVAPAAPTAPAVSPPAKPEQPAKTAATPAAQSVTPGAKELAPTPAKPANPAPPMIPKNNPPPAVKPPPAPAEKPADYLLYSAVGGVVLLLAVLTLIRLRRKPGKRPEKEPPQPAATAPSAGKALDKKQKWQIAVLAVLVAGGGAFAYVRDTPHYSLYLFKKAVAARDADAAMTYIDFESIIRNTDNTPFENSPSLLPKAPQTVSGAPGNFPQITPEDARKMASTLKAMMAPMLAEGFKLAFSQYVKSPEGSRNPLFDKFKGGDILDYSISREGKSAEVSKKDDPSVKIGMQKAGYGVWRIVKISMGEKRASL